ncbi:VOC family protein [Streptomyces platensis]|uniref:VOC family protein n=1 Tax=Streptomyces platensis TaxID=58346 RepID=UPI002E80EEB3|nr:VOC family protein [Streptomyces platensis]WUB79096.1 VOC family protein [Streptomyces platensis]
MGDWRPVGPGTAAAGGGTRRAVWGGLARGWIPPRARSRRPPGSPHGHRDGGGAGTPTRILLSIAVQDVDALLDRVGSLGGTVRGPATDMPWGQRVAHIQDPDGNAVNLTQPV